MQKNKRKERPVFKNKIDYYDYNLLAIVILLICFGF